MNASLEEERENGGEEPTEESWWTEDETHCGHADCRTAEERRVQPLLYDCLSFSQNRRNSSLSLPEDDQRGAAPHNSSSDTESSVCWFSDAWNYTCAANNTLKEDPELIGTTKDIKRVTWGTVCSRLIINPHDYNRKTDHVHQESTATISEHPPPANWEPVIWSGYLVQPVLCNPTQLNGAANRNTAAGVTWWQRFLPRVTTTTKLLLCSFSCTHSFPIKGKLSLLHPIF